MPGGEKWRGRGYVNEPDGEGDRRCRWTHTAHEPSPPMGPALFSGSSILPQHHSCVVAASSTSALRGSGIEARGGIFLTAPQQNLPTAQPARAHSTVKAAIELVALACMMCPRGARCPRCTRGRGPIPGGPSNIWQASRHVQYRDGGRARVEHQRPERVPARAISHAETAGSSPSVKKKKKEKGSTRLWPSSPGSR